MGKKTEQSQKVYNDMAPGYDASPEGNYTRPHKEEIMKKAVLRDGDNILDVACGNGHLLGELSKKAKINAYGVDISEKMIVAARERYPDCTFSVGPCTPLSFGNESMDVITVSCACLLYTSSQKTAGLLKGADIRCQDFETLLKEETLTERDFMFLDPPYDTTFSAYEGREFGGGDQERLADFLGSTRAQFILIIKNTEFIYSLYRDRDLEIYTFENQYLYNVRSRNDRTAEHLIITNIRTRQQMFPETSSQNGGQDGTH